MIFKTEKPENEDSVLIVDSEMNLIQGRYYLDDGGDYYDENGELIENALGWTELPTIVFE